MRMSKRIAGNSFTKKLLAGAAFGIGLTLAGQAGAVEIEYWQYIFDTRVKAMDQLIGKFQAANPDIKVKQTTFPYADYQTKVSAAVAAGNGPDVVQLFYGWLDGFVAAKLIQPLPKDVFPAAAIEADFFPIVSAMKRGEDYYGLPTAVRSLALFYNKKLLADAGLDPNAPPKTLDDLVTMAEKTVKRDGAGNITSEGFALDMAGQDHQWWREVLVRQFGGAPYAEGDRKVTYGDAAGAKALAFYTDLQLKRRVGQLGFMDEAQAAFKAGKATFTIDGTFRLGAFSAIKGFEWGVAELPANAQGVRSNYASYFANAITAKAEGEKKAAAAKFLSYLTSPEAMEVWLKVVGELPARRAVALTDANLANPIHGPFLAGLTNAHTTMFVDEAAQRQITMDMVNRVLLQGQSPADAVAAAATAEQALIDRVTKK
ncbi:extracellular solute-binding protein [Azospirillum agricola]|uniref:extracellular solute-binding protein n=1 Tax=Azospirillum agricola TaxID=1720247 RepID=UPI000A0F1377|nr:extracellular solute-binding protein [Azospirillum agricola]SMH28893.1 carbohydrate ABC transporter substrate-binding protein, CUT1 family [Azospirillum lipoferum]